MRLMYEGCVMRDLAAVLLTGDTNFSPVMVVHSTTASAMFRVSGLERSRLLVEALYECGFYSDSERAHVLEWLGKFPQ